MNAERHPHNHVFYPHYYSTYCVHDRHGEHRTSCTAGGTQ